MSILQEAKKLPVRKGLKNNYSSQEWQDVAIAWLKDEISLSQLMNAMKYKSTSSTYTAPSLSLRAAFKSGRLKL